MSMEELEQKRKGGENMKNKHLYEDELTHELAVQAAYDEEQEKIEEFIRYLDQAGYNFHVIKGIRSLLKHGKLSTR